MILLHFLHFINFLWACQIAQVNLHSPVRLVSGEHFLNQQLKQCMRSTTLHIHGRLPDDPILLSLLHELQTLLNISHLHFTQPLHIDSIILILMNKHFLIELVLVVLEQVHHVLIVQLQEWAVYFDIFPTLGDDFIEDVMDCAWDKTGMILVLFYAAEERGLFRFLGRWGLDYIMPVTAEHGVSFATASLPVGEDCYIKSLRTFGNKGLDILEYFPLRAGSAKHSLHLLLAITARHPDLYTFLCHRLQCTWSMQIMDYLSSSYDASSGLMRTIVLMLTDVSYSWGFGCGTEECYYCIIFISIPLI